MPNAATTRPGFATPCRNIMSPRALARELDLLRRRHARQPGGERPPGRRPPERPPGAVEPPATRARGRDEVHDRGGGQERQRRVDQRGVQLVGTHRHRVFLLPPRCGAATSRATTPRPAGLPRCGRRRGAPAAGRGGERADAGAGPGSARARPLGGGRRARGGRGRLLATRDVAVRELWRRQVTGPGAREPVLQREAAGRERPGTLRFANCASAGVGGRLAGHALRTFAACSPFGPFTTSNSTF